jgi:hypothetical protein
MSTDSDATLTKFESTVTVVTADFANSIFGGLYGSGEAASLDPNDPRVRGHVHDGAHVDGHLSRIHLQDHVEDQLQHANLGSRDTSSAAVWKSNVKRWDSEDGCIPEYEIDSETHATKYYLDLRIIREDFTFHEIESPSEAHSEISENRLIRQRVEPDWETTGFDFVFGSSSLEALHAGLGSEGNERLLFDKSKGSFRAGSVESDEWDEANRGLYSAALGRNSTASGEASTVSGGAGNTASGDNATVSGGAGNTAGDGEATVGGGSGNTATGDSSTVGGGSGNTANANNSTIAGGVSNSASGVDATIGGGDGGVASGQNSVISGGHINQATATNTSIGGGYDNQATEVRATIAGGYQNRATSTGAAVAGGYNNKAEGSYSFIGAGESNEADSDHASVLGGDQNKANSEHSTVVGGEQNKVEEASVNSFIGGGGSNKVLDGSEYSSIGGGQDNDVGVTSGAGGSTHSTIGGGQDNDIYGASTHSTIGGGQDNDIYGASTHSTVSGGQDNNIYTTGSDSVHSTIGGGSGNNITAPGSTIAGGVGNLCSGDNSAVGGGSGNEIAHPRSTIAGGMDNYTASSDTFVGGGQGNRIGAESHYSVICGGGKGSAGIGNTIAEVMSTVHFDSALAPIDATPSEYSGILGGEANQINGGVPNSKVSYTPSKTQNYILGGEGNHIAGIDVMDGGAVAHCAISFGLNNEIVAGAQQITNCRIGGGSGNYIYNSAADTIDNVSIVNGTDCVVRAEVGSLGGNIETCSIISGTKNRIATGNFAGLLSHCVVLGGYLNTFDSGYNHDSLSWGTGHGSGGGAQTSSILGGSQNKVTSDSGNYTMKTFFSTIVGGFVNEIKSSKGSVICGGGAALDSATTPYPPYTPYGAPTSTSDSGGNVINQSDYAAIVSGTGNKILGEIGGAESKGSAIIAGNQNLVSHTDGATIVSGFKNMIEKSDKVIDDKHPWYSTAAGIGSHSYNYSQHSKASGYFDLNKYNLNAYNSSAGTSQSGIHGGGIGSAQTFSIGALGHWGYSESDLTDWGTNGTGWLPPVEYASMGVPWFVAYLDGKYATKDPGRFFVPKRGSSYSFTITGSLSFTKLTGSAPWVAGSEQHSVSFAYEGGLVVDEWGNLKYGCSAIQQKWCSLGSGTIISNVHTGNPPLTSGMPFEIVFTASDSSGWSSWNGLAARSSDSISGGSSAGSIQTFFAIQVANNSNGLYVGESLSAKIDMVECSLQYRTPYV